MKTGYSFIIYLLLTITVILFSSCDETAFDITKYANAGERILALGSSRYDDIMRIGICNTGSNEWRTAASPQVDTMYYSMIKVDGTLYIIGGIEPGSYNKSSVLAYDPLKETWEQKATMPTARHGLYVVAIDGYIYAIGGFSGYGYSTEVEVYNISTNTWTTKASMPTQRGEGGEAVVVDGNIYIIGGYGTSAVESYNPTTNTWTTRTSMPLAISYFSAVCINNKIYVIGGQNYATNTPLSTLYEYDPVSDTWSTKASMPFANWKFAAGVIHGKIYTIGGISQTLDVYDPATDSWNNVATSTLSSERLTIVVYNECLYIIGDFGYMLSVEMFDPATGVLTTRTSSLLDSLGNTPKAVVVRAL